MAIFDDTFNAEIHVHWASRKCIRQSFPFLCKGYTAWRLYQFSHTNVSYIEVHLHIHVYYGPFIHCHMPAILVCRYTPYCASYHHTPIQPSVINIYFMFPNALATELLPFPYQIYSTSLEHYIKPMMSSSLKRSTANHGSSTSKNVTRSLGIDMWYINIQEYLTNTTGFRNSMSEK